MTRKRAQPHGPSPKPERPHEGPPDRREPPRRREDGEDDGGAGVPAVVGPAPKPRTGHEAEPLPEREDGD